MPKAGCSLTEARQLALEAQGLARPLPRGNPDKRVDDTLHKLGAVQLDTISVLARSHELVNYARLGPVGRAAIERTYWSRGATFEYWSHAACILPIEAYPDFAFRMRHHRSRNQRWNVDARELRRIRSVLAAEGPTTTQGLGGARRTPGWWDWSDAKVAVEWLLATGEVVVTRREGWRRVYDLASRVITTPPRPDWVDTDGVFGPSDAACIRALVRDSVRTLGVGTLDDVRDVHRLRVAEAQAALRECLEAGEVVEVTVRDWDVPAYADPAVIGRARRRNTSVTTLLSPFDSLVWHRPRLEQIFGLRHRIEAYTPAAKRVYGYFAMPLLHEGRIIALVDPGREASTLVAKRVSPLVDELPMEGVALALANAARWVDAERVRVDVAPTARMQRDLSSAANRLLDA